MDFCQWLLQQYAVDPGFPSVMWFTDEAGFTRYGIISFRNSSVWADENPHSTFQSTSILNKFVGNHTCGQTGCHVHFAAMVDRAVLSQRHSQHSAGVSGSFPFGKKSSDVVYA
jgi:hypothetical protein